METAARARRVPASKLSVEGDGEGMKCKREKGGREREEKERERGEENGK